MFLGGYEKVLTSWEMMEEEERGKKKEEGRKKNIKLNSTYDYKLFFLMHHDL